jgi:hypothetical protein
MYCFGVLIPWALFPPLVLTFHGLILPLVFGFLWSYVWNGFAQVCWQMSYKSGPLSAGRSSLAAKRRRGEQRSEHILKYYFLFERVPPCLFISSVSLFIATPPPCSDSFSPACSWHVSSTRAAPTSKVRLLWPRVTSKRKRKVTFDHLNYLN